MWFGCVVPPDCEGGPPNPPPPYPLPGGPPKPPRPKPRAVPSTSEVMRVFRFEVSWSACDCERRPAFTAASICFVSAETSASTRPLSDLPLVAFASCCERLARTERLEERALADAEVRRRSRELAEGATAAGPEAGTAAAAGEAARPAVAATHATSGPAKAAARLGRALPVERGGGVGGTCGDERDRDHGDDAELAVLRQRHEQIVADVPKRRLSIRCAFALYAISQDRHKPCLAGRGIVRGMNANLQAVEVVVPVHDEEHSLEANVDVLVSYLREEFPFPFGVVIADNASTDRTGELALELAARNSEVSTLHIDRKGRGLALRTAWLSSHADVVSYMDVDLSTNLESFLPLVAPLLSGHSEVAIGTRLGHGAHVRRQPRREVLSRGYNGIIHAGFRASFSDAQCGFKAIRADVARRLVPLVVDDGWFFDTELLLLAERNRMRIHEVPVDWIEDLDSRVDLVSTIGDDLRGLWRVRRAFWRGEGLALEPAVAL